MGPVAGLVVPHSNLRRAVPVAFPFRSEDLGLILEISLVAKAEAQRTEEWEAAPVVVASTSKAFFLPLVEAEEAAESGVGPGAVAAPNLALAKEAVGLAVRCQVSGLVAVAEDLVIQGGAGAVVALVTPNPPISKPIPIF